MGSLDHLRPLFLLERGANAGRSSLGAYRRRSSRRCGPTQADQANVASGGANRSEEHTSELQSLMRISYAVFCLKKKNKNPITIPHLSVNIHKPTKNTIH